MRPPVSISAAVEGSLDEAVAERLVTHVGGGLGPVYGKRGKGRVLAQVAGYNAAARYGPWLVLVDLDHDADCAPDAVRNWLPNQADMMCFRVVVREVEAWLLADRAELSRFLSVGYHSLPGDPEVLADPKLTMVQVAKHSRSRAVRDDIVPRPGSGRETGPAYESRLAEFVRTRWRPDVAASASVSLRRALVCLRRQVTGGVT